MYFANHGGGWLGLVGVGEWTVCDCRVARERASKQATESGVGRAVKME